MSFLYPTRSRGHLGQSAAVIWSLLLVGWAGWAGCHGGSCTRGVADLPDSHAVAGLRVSLDGESGIGVEVVEPRRV